MMRKPAFWVPALLLVALGCGKTPEEPTPDPQPVKIPLRIAVSPATRVTDTAFEPGDAIGLYVVSGSRPLAAAGNHADNAAFSYDGSRWTSAAELYWPDQVTPAGFYVYYPRAASVADIHALPFSARPDQSTLAAYKSSELLWGSRRDVKPTDRAVEITATHRMSNLLVYVVPGQGYTADSMREEGLRVQVNNLKVNASLNVETGEVTAVGSAVDITPYAEGDHFRALVPPQSLQDQTLVTIWVGNASFPLKETISLKSNTQHKVTVTVHKVGEGIDIGIGPWETDENDYGGTVNE